MKKIALRKGFHQYYENVIKNDKENEEINFNNFPVYQLFDAETYDLDKIKKIVRSNNNEELEKWIPGIKGKITVFRRIIRNFILNENIDNMILFMVFLNTLLLSLDGLIDP